MIKEKYNITGMSCAACSAKVDKTVSKLVGMDKASVNLLTNSMQVEYDEKKVPLFFLLRMYFLTIDPTQVDEQGADKGSQYRTGIYYEDEADKAIIEDAVAEESFAFSDPIATEVMPLKNFYAAEEYHQDYLDKNPSGYCHISPELMKMARETQRIDN